MIFRRTEEKDAKQVAALWEQARAYFREQKIDQWQDGYPNEESLREDMAGGESYVLEEKGEVVATAFISFRGEPDYQMIYEGSWENDGFYGVIHRVAVDASCKGRGLGGILIEEALRMCRERQAGSLRVDTHQDNRSMQRMLEKNGFSRRGNIYLGRGGARRVAFERAVFKC